MDRFTAILVDDERLARKELRSMLAEHEVIDGVGEAENVTQAAELVDAKKPDVLFLDIQLPGETGFDLLEKISHPCRIIFVTAFDAYAIRAFEVNALDYLLKPINTYLRPRSNACRPPGPHRVSQNVVRWLLACD